jgi:hypothetical protein
MCFLAISLSSFLIEFFLSCVLKTLNKYFEGDYLRRNPEVVLPSLKGSLSFKKVKVTQREREREISDLYSWMSMCITKLFKEGYVTITNKNSAHCPSKSKHDILVMYFANPK